MRKTVLYCFAAMVTLVLTGILSYGISIPFREIIILSNAVKGLSYAVLTVVFILLLILFPSRNGRTPFLSKDETGICRPRNIALWIFISILLPVAVSAFYIFFTKGELTQSGMKEGQTELQSILSRVSYAVFDVGIGAGIAEEVVFRGVIMGAIKKASNIKMAVLLPSILFGLIHMLSLQEFDPISILLLLFGGTLVGIMFSVIRIASGSVFAGAVVHAVWNAIIIGGILDISSEPLESALFRYRIHSSSKILTGGEFGIEVALPAIIGYLAVTLIALNHELFRRVSRRRGTVVTVRKLGECRHESRHME